MRKAVILIAIISSLDGHSSEMESSVRKAILKTDQVSKIVDRVEGEARDMAERGFGKNGASLAALAVGSGLGQKIKFKSNISDIGIEGAIAQDEASLRFTLNF